MDLGSLPLQSAMELTNSSSTSPCLRDHPKRRAVLQADGVKLAVERLHVHGKGVRRVIHRAEGLLEGARREGSGAMKRCLRRGRLNRPRTTARHLEFTSGYLAIHVQVGVFQCERMQEEDASQADCTRSRGGGSSHLQIACTRKDHAALNDVVEDDLAKRARQRAIVQRADGGGELMLHEWMG